MGRMSSFISSSSVDILRTDTKLKHFCIIRVVPRGLDYQEGVEGHIVTFPSPLNSISYFLSFDCKHEMSHHVHCLMSCNIHPVPLDAGVRESRRKERNEHKHEPNVDQNNKWASRELFHFPSFLSLTYSFHSVNSRIQCRDGKASIKIVGSDLRNA